MKLKQILNEVKLVPPNRILLRQDEHGRYGFETQGEKFTFTLLELQQNNVMRSFYNTIRKHIFTDFLDSKHIKYTIKRDGKWGEVLIIDAKYFITPDPINEVKIIRDDRVLKLETFKDDDYLYRPLYIVFKLRENNYTSFYHKDLEYDNYCKLINELDNKKIPYKHGNVSFNFNYISIPKEYIITVNNKVNEVKLIKGTKNPYLNILLINKDLEARFKIYLEYDYYEKNSHWDNAQSFFGFYDGRYDYKNNHKWKNKFANITKEQIIEIIKYYKDQVNHYGNELEIPKL